MPSGGIRAGAGRPPQENSRRRDRAAAKQQGAPGGQSHALFDGDWLTLPKDGRKGQAPAWPFPVRATAAERKMWTDLWKLPQAIGWERAHQHQQVALYVRTVIRAQDPRSAIGLTNSARQMQDSLGLSEAGLRMLRWRIASAPRLGAAASSDSSPESQQAAAPTAAPTPSVKGRLRVVPDAAG